MKVEEVDAFGLQLAEEIRRGMAVSGHNPQVVQRLQRLEKAVAKAHLDFRQGASRRNDTLAARGAQTLLQLKDRYQALMKGPNRLDIDLNIDH